MDKKPARIEDVIRELQRILKTRVNVEDINIQINFPFNKETEKSRTYIIRYKPFGLYYNPNEVEGRLDSSYIEFDHKDS